MPDIVNWPDWLQALLWTAGTLAVSWGVGRAIAAILRSRGTHWLAGRDRPWVEAALRVVHKRLPWWFLLLGVWVASGYWPLTPEARVLIGRAVFAIVAGSMTLALATVASRMVDSYGGVIAPGLPVTSLTRNVAWGIVAVIGLLVVLNGVGLSIAPMLAALGVGGIAVALALQEPLANFFAGVFIVLAGQIRVGDYVKLDTGHEGYVVDFGWRSTRLRMLANNLVVVPNSKLAQAIVVNHHLPSPDLAVLVDVGVDYASDLAHVERVTIEVAREVMAEVAGGVPEFQPFIRFHTFGDSSIDFSVILRGKEFTDQYLIKHEFVRRLHERYNREGIVIPFPIRTIARREPEAPAAAAAPSPALE